MIFIITYTCLHFISSKEIDEDITDSESFLAVSCAILMLQVCHSVSVFISWGLIESCCILTHFYETASDNWRYVYERNDINCLNSFHYELEHVADA